MSSPENTSSENHDDQVHRSTKDRLQEAWQSTMGHFATAEDGSRNLVQRLVSWGKLTGDEGKTMMNDWRRSIEENRRQLEMQVEETVHRSLSLFTIPSAGDLESMTDQVTRLEKRLASLLRKRKGGEKA